MTGPIELADKFVLPSRDQHGGAFEPAKPQVGECFICLRQRIAMRFRLDSDQ
jgi:hypothetical protein